MVATHTAHMDFKTKFSYWEMHSTHGLKMKVSYWEMQIVATHNTHGLKNLAVGRCKLLRRTTHMDLKMKVSYWEIRIVATHTAHMDT